MGSPAPAAAIVEQAEVIVRVEATSFEPQGHWSKDIRYGLIHFKVKEVLKGELKKDTVALEGTIDIYDGPNDRPPPYDLVRPGGRRGSCHAEDYKLGTEFLLFLKSSTVYWAPLSATNEEVSGPNDPWVWWVKGYLAGKTTADLASKAPARSLTKP
jgi:hypothetical protein